MALTDIAKQLKETFTGFDVVAASALTNELAQFVRKYGKAEAIRIGEMDYIVIDGVYQNQDNADENQQLSPLFYNSINHDYAIIDAETSSTLIDEVYSRVTYMKKECAAGETVDNEKIKAKISKLIGDENPKNVSVKVLMNANEAIGNKAKIFQCRLIKDTGVSAVPDVFSFMLENGENGRIKEIADTVMRRINRSEGVELLNDRAVLEKNKKAIQKAVFDKYAESDIEIQSVNVKSIFEISLSFSKVSLFYSVPIDITDKKASKDDVRNAVFNTVYIASKDNEFDKLNENVHVCDSCGRDIVDIRDENVVHKLHVNIDAIDEKCSDERNIVFAVGCESCLVQCEKCGGWHFDYDKISDAKDYEKVKLAPGRAFIKGLTRSDGTNYCSCRECIEWIYDEKTGDAKEHDVIAVDKMAFINYAGEKIASYAEYKKFYDKELGKKTFKSSIAEYRFAKNTFAKFKRELSARTNIDVDDIIVTSADNCETCRVCHGEFYRGATGGNYMGAVADGEFRCDICHEMDTEKVNMVTRIDGTVFLRNGVGKRRTVSKYTVSKLGTLKKISSVVIGENEAPTELPEDNE